MKLLITGPPRGGKSTIVERLIEAIPGKSGFITKEVREAGERIGFEIITHTGARKILSSIRLDTPYKVPRSTGGVYNVDVDGFNHMLAPLFHYGTTDLLYIDEIGRMELFSEQFKALVETYLDAPNDFIGTIASAYEDDFTRSIKKRQDVTIIEITAEDREQKYNELRQLLSMQRDYLRR